MPRKEFVDIFSDIDIPGKPDHPLSRGKEKLSTLIGYRKQYDEFIANVDSEVGLLVNALDQAGLLQNTYLFILAEHGELLDRGEQGHITPLMYDPVLHIPLIVYAPGQKSRRDVFSPTSNVDILPTILRTLGKDSPPYMDGKTLPGFGGQDDDERSIFSIEAKKNSALAPLTEASISMIKGHKKLISARAYLHRGLEFAARPRPEDQKEEERLFRKALAIEPGLEAAHAGMSRVSSYLYTIWMR